MPLPRTLTATLAAAGGLTAAAALGLRHPVFGAPPRADRRARMEASPQWRDGAFRHPASSFSSPSPHAVWDWLTGKSPHTRPSVPVPTRACASADFDTPQALRATWLGHATSLVEIDGLRLLVDPVFGPTASPGRAFGVARFFELPLPLDALPALDAVLLTHDHYDHLDYGTVRRLAGRVPRWLAPLGVGAHLERWGVPPERITEFDWWDETNLGGVRIVCTPSRHFSGRALGDRNRTLWCGWALVGAERRMYLSGDGGMQPQFAEIGARLGPFDLTLMEVGAYNRHWADIHMGPEQAVEAHRQVGGGVMVPVHWGTFELALHGWTEPVERALVAAERSGVRLAVPRPGECVDPAQPAPVERWWPEVPWQTADEAPIVSAGL
jgi:L-ascorbate metabolism protein UlaG (beta-lactamase superfamily)